MGIKLIANTNSWSAWYAKRHPITKKPISLKRIGFKSKFEALRAEKELILQVEDRIRAKTIPNWQKLTELWAEDARNRGLTEKTIENYLYSLKAYTFLKWACTTVDTISTAEIRDVILTDLASKSDLQKMSVLKFIRCVFEYGVQAAHLNRNPTPTMKFRTGQKLKKVLSKEQVETLLTRAKEMNCEWYPHWCTAIYTGLRNGELYALTWDKVDFENNHILVDCSWSAQNGLKSTKSGHDRLVPIAPPLRPILEELKLKNSSFSEYVLPRIGKWDKGDQARELRFFLAGLGQEPIRFHDLRATFATLLLQTGVEPIKVMKAGGWQSMKTMQVYVRKSGVDTSGMMDNFVLHDHNAVRGKVLDLFPAAKAIGSLQ